MSPGSALGPRAPRAGPRPGLQALDPMAAALRSGRRPLYRRSLVDPQRRPELLLGDRARGGLHPVAELSPWEDGAGEAVRLEPLARTGRGRETPDGLQFDLADGSGVVTLADSADVRPPEVLVDWEGVAWVFTLQRPPRIHRDGWARFPFRLSGGDWVAGVQPERGVDGWEPPAWLQHSAAIYHRKKRHNPAGGVAYRSGKAAHLVRPWCEALDAAGARVGFVWGRWEWDPRRGRLTKALPAHAFRAGVSWRVDADLGYTSTPTFLQTMQSFIYATGVFDTPSTAAGSVSALQVCCQGNTGRYLRGLIYQDDGTEAMPAGVVPSSVIDSAAEMPTSKGWQALSYSGGPTLYPGDPVWLAACYAPTSPTTGGSLFYDSVSGYQFGTFEPLTPLADPNEDTGPTFSSVVLGIYAEYTPGATVPDAPDNLDATPADQQVTLTWDPVGAATSHNLYWSTSPGVTRADTKVAGVTSPHDHTGLVNLQWYYYRVAAVSAAGESALSSEARARPAEYISYERGARTMDPADYEPVWSLAVRRAALGREIALELVEDLSLDTALPAASWTRAATEADLDADAWTYPHLEDQAEGRPVPVAYGTVYDAAATCVDTTAGTFRVTGHAITRFLQIRDPDGVPIEATGVDLTRGQFTWADYDGSGSPTADFLAPLANPADALEDLLERAGVPAERILTPDAADEEAGTGFGTDGSRSAWVLGSDPDGDEVPRPALGLYLDTSRPARDWVERVAAAAGALVYPDALGRWTCRPWAVVPSEGTTRLDAHEIFRAVPEVSVETATTRVVARYAHRQAGDWAPAVVLESAAARDRLGLAAHITLELDLAVAAKEDARQVAARELAMRRQPLKLWRIEANQRALLLTPGDPVRLYKERPASSTTGDPVVELDGFYEVLAVEIRPGAAQVALTVCDWRGLADRPGFWTADAPTFPADLGGGSAATWSAAWSDAQKRWARENLGYWADDDGYTGTKDADSYLGSVWQ